MLASNDNTANFNASGSSASSFVNVSSQSSVSAYSSGDESAHKIPSFILKEQWQIILGQVLTMKKFIQYNLIFLQFYFKLKSIG